jgi:hypothetical protein
MELLFVTLISFCIGLLVRYVVPGRDTYGVVLLPSIAAAATAIVWVALTWVGWKFDGGWIWVASLAVGGVLSLALGLLLPRSRRTNDQEMLHKLSRA